MIYSGNRTPHLASPALSNRELGEAGRSGGAALRQPREPASRRSIYGKVLDPKKLVFTGESFASPAWGRPATGARISRIVPAFFGMFTGESRELVALRNLPKPQFLPVNNLSRQDKAARSNH
jgi:hypothetical protein